jgi:cyclopropane fatty-acyl-phospholipid synthase-like methyltransferase
VLPDARANFQVGLNTSERLLDLAQQAVPEMTLLRGDMRHADLDGPFDALVAWDSVFHVACSEHGALFHKFYSWLRLGGRLLLSLGGSAGEFTSEMWGETLLLQWPRSQ